METPTLHVREFSGYGLHGTTHPQSYPPGARFLFSRLPLLSARTDPESTPTGEVRRLRAVI